MKGPRSSLSLKLSDTRDYEPQIRARLGATAHCCNVVVPKLRAVSPAGAVPDQRNGPGRRAEGESRSVEQPVEARRKFIPQHNLLHRTPSPTVGLQGQGAFYYERGTPVICCISRRRRR